MTPGSEVKVVSLQLTSSSFLHVFKIHLMLIFLLPRLIQIYYNFLYMNYYNWILSFVQIEDLFYSVII